MKKQAVFLNRILIDNVMDAQKEIEKEMLDKIKMFPSFQPTDVQIGQNGDDFVNNMYSVKLIFKQENVN